MIGLICAFFIGKYFYKLAKDYNHNKLLFTVLGVLCFYFGSLVLGHFTLYYFFGFRNYNFKLFSFFGTEILTMPFGIVIACLLHYLLEKRWKTTVDLVKDEINDIGKNLDEH